MNLCTCPFFLQNTSLFPLNLLHILLLLMESEHLVAPLVIPIDIKFPALLVAGGLQESMAFPLILHGLVAAYWVGFFLLFCGICEVLHCFHISSLRSFKPRNQRFLLNSIKLSAIIFIISTSNLSSLRSFECYLLKS